MPDPQTPADAPVGLKPMPETPYRNSRWLRVLGSPAAYLVFSHLGPPDSPKSVSNLAAETGLRVKNVSDALRHLRQVDLVRYEARGRHKVYWLKDPEVAALLRQLEARIDRLRGQTW